MEIPRFKICFFSILHTKYCFRMIQRFQSLELYAESSLFKCFNTIFYFEIRLPTSKVLRSISLWFQIKIRIMVT